MKQNNTVENNELNSMGIQISLVLLMVSCMSFGMGVFVAGNDQESVKIFGDMIIVSFILALCIPIVSAYQARKKRSVQ